MAAAHPAAPYMRKFHRDDRFSRQCYDPADRADKAGFLIAPAHASREIEPCDKRSEKSGQYFFHHFPFIHHLRPGIFSLFDQIGRGNPLSPCKSLGGFCHISVFIIRGADRRPAFFHFLIRLRVRSGSHDNSQPSRCGVNVHLFKSNPRFIQLGAGKSMHLLNDAGHHICRHFFRTDFQKKIFRHSRHFLSAWGIPVPYVYSGTLSRTYAPDFSPGRYTPSFPTEKSRRPRQAD